MKFALTALTSVACGLVSAQDPTRDLQALQAEYVRLAPKLVALIPNGGKDIPANFDLDLGSLGSLMAIKKTPFPYSGVGPTHFEAVRDYGYVELADRMEQSARTGLEAGRVGLQAEIPMSSYLGFILRYRRIQLYPICGRSEEAACLRWQGH